MWGYISTKVAHLMILVLNLLAPASANLQRDISYGSQSYNRADVYRQDRGSAHPVVVFLYGGGWQSGSKERVAYVGAALARKGFAVVIPEFRHFPAAGLSDILSDNAKAVVWAAAHASEFGGDPRRIFVAGHSSGAWAAIMLALDSKWLRQTGSEPIALAGAIGLAGPYEISSLAQQADKDVFVGSGPEMEPINDCSAQHPPILLIAGTADDDVSPSSTTDLSDQMRKFGNKAETHTYPGFGHDQVLHAVSFPFSMGSSVSDTIQHFVNASGNQ